jgi:hypothetical protein
MPASTYSLPPCPDVHIAPLCTPSPGHDNLEAPGTVAGVELIVNKLPCNSVTSAAACMQAMLEEYTELHGANALVPIRITPGDERNLVDYVFISVDPHIACNTPLGAMTLLEW